MPDDLCFSCPLEEFSRLSTELLRLGTSIRFQARGGSMAPLVREGDVLFVEALHGRSGRFGEVVMCALPGGRMVVHRVVGRRKRPGGIAWLIKGDVATATEDWLSGDQILGRVTLLEREGRQVPLSRASMVFLGWLAAWRSRWGFLRGVGVHWGVKLLKRIPAFATLLA